MAYSISFDDIDSGLAMLLAAHDLSPRDASLQSDIAAAYLLRAQRHNRPEDVVRALSWTHRALQLDGSLREARFNEALALDSLHLTSAAVAAWRKCYDAESDRGWRAEVLSRLRMAQRDEHSAIAWAREREKLVARRADTAKIAERFTQAARNTVEEDLLPSWAAAHAAGHAAQASDNLRLARGLAEALAGRGGDTLLRESILAIDEAVTWPDRGERLAALVEGHLAYRRGLDLSRSFKVVPAIEQLHRAAEAFARGHSPFQLWAELQLAVCDYYRSDYPASLRALAALRLKIGDRPFLSLYGRIGWIQGLGLYALGRPAEAVDAYQEALASFSRSGEEESVTAVHSLIADSLRTLNEDGEAWLHRYQALRGLPGLRESRRRHAVLGEASLASLKLGEPLGAKWFQDEAVRLALASGSEVEIAEALRARAALQMRAGMPAAALGDLQEAERRSQGIDDPAVQLLTRGRIGEVNGQILQTTRPEESLLSLSKAVEAFRATDYGYRLSQALFARAGVHFSLGHRAEAEADLRNGLSELEAVRGNAPSLEVAPVSQVESETAGQVIRLALELGWREEALDAVERWRSRALLSAVSQLPMGVRGRLGAGSVDRALRAQEILRQLPDGTVLVEYALEEERLAIWIVRRDGLVLRRLPVRKSDITAWTDNLQRRLQGGSAGPEVRRTLQALHTALVHPFAAELSGGENLVFVPDPSLSGVPFPALLDPGTGRYLIQDHAVTIAPSATLYLRSLAIDRQRADGGPSPALVVGAPPFDTHLFPGLPPLPGAAAEAERVAALYPGARRLFGAAATREQFLSLLSGSQVVHVATHALSNRETPLVSMLLLAPAGADSGVLYAHELLGLRLARPRLVVLSACGTAGSGGAGVSGFVRPFLAAGVPAIVASLWRVDDERSVRLLEVFHRRFRAGDSAPRALQAAQLALLADREASSPAVWAAFEVFGGSSSVNPRPERRNP